MSLLLLELDWYLGTLLWFQGWLHHLQSPCNLKNVSLLLKVGIYFIDFKMVTAEYWTKQGPCHQSYICNCVLRWQKSCHVLVLEEPVYRISVIGDFNGLKFSSEQAIMQDMGSAKESSLLNLDWKRKQFWETSEQKHMGQLP